MPKVFDKKLLIIYGPTATGKTNLAIRLAKKFNGELISADSRQVYKGLDIGSGKVSFESKVEKHRKYWIVNGVKIHGFDLVNPGQNFSVADFLSFASTTMIQIIGVKKLPIVVGGTGFYIKALIDGVESIGVPSDIKLRKQLEKLSVDQLYQKLLEIDPKRAKSMNPSDRANPRRLIRAIEIAMTPEFSARHSGVATTTISAFSFAESDISEERHCEDFSLARRPADIESGSYRSVSLRSRMTNYLMVGLTAPSDYLYSRCDKWLKIRLKHGMIEEVENLIKGGIDPQWLDDLGLEYRWLSRYLSGKINYYQAIDRLKGDIHSFIRRQKTWFKKFNEMKLFDISKPSCRQKLEKTVKDWIT